MPSYYAAGVKARLSVCSLAASTTAEPCLQQNPAHKDKLAQAQWTIDNGEDLKEQTLRCLGEDGRLHFIGPDLQIPFICVSVDIEGRLFKEPEVLFKDDQPKNAIASTTESPLQAPGIAQTVASADQKEDEDSSLTSLGSTPGQTPDRSAPLSTEEATETKLPAKPAAKPVAKRKKRARSHFSTRARTSKPTKAGASEPAEDVSEAESTTVTSNMSKPGPSTAISTKPPPKIKLKLGKAETKAASPAPPAKESTPIPQWPSASSALDPRNSAGPGHIASYATKQIPPPARLSPFALDRKALTLNTQFLPICFTRSKSDASNDLKIEVFFNGDFANSSYLSCREKNSLSELAVKFGGTRIHRLQERPWTIQQLTGVEFDKAEAVEDSFELEENRQKRWKDICVALRSEADAVGCNRAGKKPPSSIALESLSNMPMPDDCGFASLAGGLAFGVIDLVITLGEGSKKWEDAGGYLTKALRLQDPAFSIDNIPKKVTQMPAGQANYSEYGGVRFNSLADSSLMVASNNLIMATMHPVIDPQPAGQMHSANMAMYARPTFAPSLTPSYGMEEPTKLSRINPNGLYVLRTILGVTPQTPMSATQSPSSAQNLPRSTSWSITKSQTGSKRPMPPASSPPAQEAVQRPISLPPGVSQANGRPPDFAEERRGLSSSMPPYMFVSPQLTMLALPPTSRSDGGYQAQNDEIHQAISPKALQYPPYLTWRLTPLQRYGRRPRVLINGMAHSLHPRCTPIIPSSHGLTSKLELLSSGPSTPINTKQKVNENSAYTPTGPSALVKLRLPTPKKAGVALSQVSKTGQRRKSVSKQGKRVVSSEGNHTAAGKAPMKPPPKLKRRQSGMESSTSAEPKQKKRRTSGFGVPALLKSPSASTSPERLLMPPPPSPEKLVDYVMPELSKNCVISYVCDEDLEGQARSRQVRSTRGGSFKEKEVLVVMRFVVGL